MVTFLPSPSVYIIHSGNRYKTGGWDGGNGKENHAKNIIFGPFLYRTRAAVFCQTAINNRGATIKKTKQNRTSRVLRNKPALLPFQRRRRITTVHARQKKKIRKSHSHPTRFSLRNTRETTHSSDRGGYLSYLRSRDLVKIHVAGTKEKRGARLSRNKKIMRPETEKVSIFAVINYGKTRVQQFVPTQ